MRVQRSSQLYAGRDCDRDFALQHDFPEAVIQHSRSAKIQTGRSLRASLMSRMRTKLPFRYST